MSRILILVLLVALAACHKEWEEPVVYTMNLSLLYEPDSVDEDLVYHYADGMKVQLQLNLTSSGSAVKNGSWTNKQNFHWGDSLESVAINAKVVSMLNDTSYHIEDYPLIMRVYEND